MTALADILSQEIVQRLGWTLLHFIWQAAAIALLLAVLLAALRKSSSNLRYTVTCMALGLIVLMPVVTFELVPVSIPEPPMMPAPAPVVAPIERVSELHTVEVSTFEPPLMVENAEATPHPDVPWKQRISEKLEPALPHVVSAWLIGVLALSVWHLGGWTQLQRLRRKMVKPVDESLHVKLSKLARSMGVRRAVALSESALVRIPTVVGWLRPAILLPASALTGLSPEQLDAILAHELAHIRRHDYLVNMLQTAVETLGFYHPAVWWVSHKIRTEREHCCDDLAIVATGDRVRYARALTLMEEIRGRSGELAMTATGGNLFARIHRLIGRNSDEKTFGWIPAVTVILLLVALIFSTTLALTTNEKYPAAESITSKPENEPLDAEKNDSSARVLIETQILHVNNDSLEQVGLDADSLKNSNSWSQYRVDDSANPSMFVIDSHTKKTLLKTVDESEDSSSISRIFLMTMSGREATIKNNSGYDFESQELGRLVKIRPTISQDGQSTYLDCELLTRWLLPIDASKEEIVEYKTNAENALLSDDDTLLILGGKPISNLKGQKNVIILMKTSVVRPERNDDVDSKASSYDVAKYIGTGFLKGSDLLRVFLDLHLEPGQYVEIKKLGEEEEKFKQVETGDIGKAPQDWPAYKDAIFLDIRSNFDLDLSTKRYTRNSLFKNARWDAYFTQDTITGNGRFAQTVLSIEMWKAKLYALGTADDDIIPSLVAVIIKPSNKPQESSAEAIPAENVRSQPQVTKGPAPAGTDKAHVRIDCHVLEMYPSMTIDRETLISAENLLGQSVLMPAAGGKVVPHRRWPSGRDVSRSWKPTIEEFIRQVTGTMVSTEHTSSVTDDAETMRKLIDLLASRGYMKILMNPTLEVVDGGTARVSSVQKVPKGKTATPSDQSDHHLDVTDYLQITPHILDDGNIKLLAEGTIHRHLSHQDKEPPPAITSSSFSSEVVIEPGMSLMVGVRKTTGTDTEAESRAETPEQPRTETMFILTPTIVETTKLQDKTDEGIEAGTEAPEQPISEKVYRCLERIVDLEGLSARMSFEQVINELERAAVPPLRIQPNWNDLRESANVERTTLVDMAPLMKVKLGKALEMLLASVSTDSAKVGYVVDEGVIVIATKNALPRNMVMRVYHIADLTGEPADHGGLSRLMQVHNLARLIQKRIDPKSWYDLEMDGEGTMTPFPLQDPKKLAVYNTPKSHREIERLLEEIRSGVERVPTEYPDQMTIRGRCIDSDGRPIPDARIVLYSMEDAAEPIAESRTNSRGQFRLGPVASLTEEDTGRKRYLVFMPADDHGPAWKEIYKYEQSIGFLELKTYEPAEVFGKIVKDDSKPVAGAKVWVRRIIAPEATEAAKSRANDLYVRAPLEKWSAATKSDGSFRIAGVADRARIQLSVSHPDFAASIVDVKPGKDSVIEVQPAATVTGRVLYGKTGKPAAGVKVQAQGVDHVSVPGGFMNSWAQTRMALP